MAATRTTATAERKRYQQYCPVARGLDLLGERWTLLVVRDLIMGPRRYTDLRQGLPGIATDLLTARLRALEGAGLVRRRKLPRPAPATVYELTDAGWQVAPVVLWLGRVGLTSLGAPSPGLEILAGPTVLTLRVLFDAARHADLEESYALEIDGEPFAVEVSGGSADTRPGTPEAPAMRLSTDARTLVEMLRGEVSAAEAIGAGRAQLEGARATLARFIDAFSYPPDAA
jgi:DNA-binding HxlR family transcriptional regulator